MVNGLVVELAAKPWATATGPAAARTRATKMAAKSRTGSKSSSMDEEAIKAEALRCISAVERLPRLVVFDLDYTLWPFWCECLSKRDEPHLYPQVDAILKALKEKDIPMAIASRTPTPDTARAFLNKLKLTAFSPMEIYPSWSHKVEHFQKIQQKSGVPFNEMLFFDDEYRNIKAVSQMEVTSILVDDGVNLQALKQGLKEFNQAAKTSSS